LAAMADDRGKRKATDDPEQEPEENPEQYKRRLYTYMVYFMFLFMIVEEAFLVYRNMMHLPEYRPVKYKVWRDVFTDHTVLNVHMSYKSANTPPDDGSRVYLQPESSRAAMMRGQAQFQEAMEKKHLENHKRELEERELEIEKQKKILEESQRKLQEEKEKLEQLSREQAEELENYNEKCRCHGDLIDHLTVLERAACPARQQRSCTPNPSPDADLQTEEQEEVQENHNRKRARNLDADFGDSQVPGEEDPVHGADADRGDSQVPFVRNLGALKKLVE